MVRFKYILFFLIFIATSCHYHKDRLKIINNSKEEIWAIPITKSIKTNSYYEVAAACEIKPLDTASPITRNSIRNDIQDEDANKKLYLIFCKYENLDFTVNHLDEIMKKKSSKYEIYSLKELDSLNWVVEYKK